MPCDPINWLNVETHGDEKLLKEKADRILLYLRIIPQKFAKLDSTVL
jgi:hypothetical protein